MAHNARIRAVWNNGTALLNTELDAFDAAQFAAVNGDGGGTYAPAAQLIIGGSGVSLTGTNSFANMTLTGTAKPLLASRAIVRYQPGYGVTDNGTGAPTGGTWIYVTGGAVAGIWRQNVINTAELYIPLNPVHGDTLQIVTVRYLGSAAHGAGAPPGTMPTLRIYRADMSTGAQTQIGSTGTDASGTIAAYELLHDITCSAIAHVVDRTVNRYYALLRGETGGNNFTGSDFYGFKMSQDCVAIDECP
jgi:hypothetical protein